MFNNKFSLKSSKKLNFNNITIRTSETLIKSQFKTGHKHAWRSRVRLLRKNYKKSQNKTSKFRPSISSNFNQAKVSYVDNFKIQESS